jgi:hypothetical protein
VTNKGGLYCSTWNTVTPTVHWLPQVPYLKEKYQTILQQLLDLSEGKKFVSNGCFSKIKCICEIAIFLSLVDVSYVKLNGDLFGLY